MAGDFSGLYGSERYSDVAVVLYEEEDGPCTRSNKRKRGAEEVLPCHGVVLWAYSTYFKTKMDNWSSNDTTDSCRASKSPRTRSHDSPAQQRQQIELPVPKGQLEAGRLLIKAMYEAAPDLSAVDQVQLLQLLLLADRYQVPRAMEAAAAALKAIPTDEFSWEAVAAVHSLPAACADLPACSGIFAAAAAKVHHELGDLEQAWADDNKQELLIQLPFAALKQLVQDPLTRVASEGTVLYTISQWCSWQQQMPAGQQPSDQQLRELVGLVRMRHCSSSYVATIFAATEVAERALQRQLPLLQELVQLVGFVSAAAINARRNDNDSDSDCEEEEMWPVLKAFPDWTKQSRPRSTRSAEILKWCITSSELQQVYEAYASGQELATLESPTTVYRGLKFQLGLQVEKERVSSSCSSGSQDAGADGSSTVEVTFFTHVLGLKVSELAACRVKREVTVERVQGGRLEGRNRTKSPFDCKVYGTFTAENCGWGHFSKLAPVGSWADFQSAFRQLGVLQADGSIHTKLKVLTVK